LDLAEDMHPANNLVIQILDRKRYGQQPPNPPSLLLNPAQYLLVRRNGATGWVKGSLLISEAEIALRRDFELRYPRTFDLPCNQLKDYPNGGHLPETPGDESDDEVPLNYMWHKEVEAYFDK
jgi:hypothetical protein